jgi:hypothetical protein
MLKQIWIFFTKKGHDGHGLNWLSYVIMLPNLAIWGDSKLNLTKLSGWHKTNLDTFDWMRSTSIFTYWIREWGQNEPSHECHILDNYYLCFFDALWWNSLRNLILPKMKCIPTLLPILLQTTKLSRCCRLTMIWMMISI